jgi:hypothetical protein
MVVQGMNLKQRLLRLEAAFLPPKPIQRVIFIVLKKGQSTVEALAEHMLAHNISERPQKIIFFEIVDAAHNPRPQSLPSKAT